MRGRPCVNVSAMNEHLELETTTVPSHRARSVANLASTRATVTTIVAAFLGV